MAVISSHWMAVRCRPATAPTMVTRSVGEYGSFRRSSRAASWASSGCSATCAVPAHHLPPPQVYQSQEGDIAVVLQRHFLVQVRPLAVVHEQQETVAGERPQRALVLALPVHRRSFPFAPAVQAQLVVGGANQPVG